MTFLGAGILAFVLLAGWLAWEVWSAPIVDDEPAACEDEVAWGVWIGMETWTPHERRHGGAL